MEVVAVKKTQLKERNVSVSVNDGIDAVTSQTITYSANAGRISDDLGKITILPNGTPKVNSTSVTTYGDDGWTTGSNYEVNVFCYKWAKFCVEKDGSLSVEDL